MKDELYCQHKWIPLLGKVGEKDVSTLLFTCLKCGELKVGTKTIRISRYRLDMDGKPIKNAGAITGTTITGSSLVKSGGTSSQPLHADGSVTTMQKGETAVSWTGGVITDFTITFPTAFASTPTVVATLISAMPNTGLYSYNMQWVIKATPTTTSFIFRIDALKYCSAAAALAGSGSVSWIAWV